MPKIEERVGSNSSRLLICRFVFEKLKIGDIALSAIDQREVNILNEGA